MSKAYSSLYIKKMNDCIVVILIYVDDLIIGGDSMDEMRLKKNLEMQFHMKDLGDLRYFLGIEIIRSESGICMLHK